MFRNVLAMGAVAGISLLLASCGGGASDGPETVDAKGTVTIDGTPTGKLSVAFIPASGGKIATGETDAQGNFTLMTNEPGDGAVVGSYKVSFSVIPDEVPEMPGFDGATEPEAPPFAKKYTDESTSEITATVDADPTKNVFKFDLEKP